MAGVLDSQPPQERSRLLGDIVTLMTQSPSHDSYTIKHLPTIVLPPVQLNQYRIYHGGDGNPVGFVSWAMLSKAAENKFLNKAAPLTLDEWRSGDIMYFMEFIAPFGRAKQIAADLKQRFPNQKAHALRFDPGRNTKKIHTFYGVDYTEN